MRFDFILIFVISAHLIGCRDRPQNKSRQTPADPAPSSDDSGDDDGNDDPGEETPPPSPFGKRVRPTLASIQTKLINPYCLPCHNAKTHQANLDLTDLGVYADGSHGPSNYRGQLITPAAPLDSMLFLVLKSVGRDRMPPAGANIPSADKAQIQAVSTWIAALPKPTDDGGSTDEPGDEDDESDTDEPGADDDGGGTDEP